MSELTPNANGASSGPSPCEAWFCLRTHPKHEHLAATHLRKYESLEVLNPLVRVRRNMPQGMGWVVESMFPNYLFARFNWSTSLNRIHYSPGISGVVHFGNKWPTIPVDVIEGLRALCGEGEIIEIDSTPKPGDVARVISGTFMGLEAVVTRVMPGRDRVTLLIDFLGRQTAVEMSLSQVVRDGIPR
ncbi:MAG: KOW motif-containing protein [Verrucomicrobia bacterium]|nr:KOW motif-containing protein [Verrucomicrobiota bacterium]